MINTKPYDKEKQPAASVDGQTADKAQNDHEDAYDDHQHGRTLKWSEVPQRLKAPQSLVGEEQRSQNDHGHSNQLNEHATQSKHVFTRHNNFAYVYPFFFHFYETTWNRRQIMPTIIIGVTRDYQ